MALGLLAVWGLVGWTIWRLERLSVSPWQAKRGYFALALLLAVGISVAGLKAWSYRYELRDTIARCR